MTDKKIIDTIIQSIYSCSCAKYFNVDKSSYLYKKIESEAHELKKKLLNKQTK